jgi:hypothetical protein
VPHHSPLGRGELGRVRRALAGRFSRALYKANRRLAIASSTAKLAKISRLLGIARAAVRTLECALRLARLSRLDA